MKKAIFVHIPKTAGSTLRTLITQNYAANEVLSLYGDPKEVVLSALDRRVDIAGYQLVQGHIPYGIHRYLGIRTPQYFTFLRDPIERFISDVAFVRRDAENNFHTFLAGDELSDDEVFSKALELSYYRNTMTHYVCGTYTTEEVSLSQLGWAVDNLWTSEFVGLAEAFDVSLLLMAKKLGWKYVVPQMSNVRPDSRQSLSAQARQRLERALAYDRALYAVAQDHLANQRKHYGVLLEEAALELGELIRAQAEAHPEAQFQRYLVGQPLEISLTQYHACVGADSALYRWLNG